MFASSSFKNGVKVFSYALTVLVEVFRAATLESPLFFGAERSTYMRKLQRHLKALSDELAVIDAILIQPHLSVEDKRLQEARVEELMLAHKQLDTIVAFTTAAAKHGVSSGAFAKSVATEMHRMTLPPVLVPADILPSCMLLAHYKCSLEDCSHKDFWARCTIPALQEFVLPEGESPESVAADIMGDKIAQYTKGGKGKADIRALEAWLAEGASSKLPVALAQQVAAVAQVVRVACCARNSAKEELSGLGPKDIQDSVAVVLDSKNTIACTLLLYPEGRAVVEAAKQETTAMLAAIELRSLVSKALGDKAMGGMAKLQQVCSNF